MEKPEFGDALQRPELDKVIPATLFMYAQDKQRWLRERVSREQMHDAINHLVEELEGYISQKFEMLPEISVQASDIICTKSVTSAEPGRYSIEHRPLPFDNDDAMFGEHSLEGRLYGFHKGIEGDLRVYMNQVLRRLPMPGGVYVPLLSVAVEGSDIRLKELRVAEQLESKRGHIERQLEKYSQPVRDLVELFYIDIDLSEQTVLKRLQSCSFHMAQIARYKEVSQQFLDDLIDVVSVKLELDTPQDMRVDSHRVVITERPTASYKPRGPAHFTNVIPQIGLLGESTNKALALFFLKKEEAIQVPVQYITAIQKTK